MSLGLRADVDRRLPEPGARTPVGWFSGPTAEGKAGKAGPGAFSLAARGGVEAQDRSATPTKFVFQSLSIGGPPCPSANQIHTFYRDVGFQFCGIFSYNK